MEKRNVLKTYMDKVTSMHEKSKKIITSLQEALREKTLENERLQEELRISLEQSNLDPFTGVFHKTAIEKRASEFFNLFKRNLSKPLAGIYLDIDDFKKVNDTYGHDAGDRVLKTIVEKLQECVRETDVIGRVGGDEFLLLLPGSDESGAMKVAKKMTEMLASTPIPLGTKDGKKINITISMGVIEAAVGMESVECFLSKLDQHMFENKRQRKLA